LKRIIDIFKIDLDATGRTFGLDIMRAVGILTVMEEHSFHLIADYVPHGVVFIPYMDKISFFFVLSGFLIGNIIMKLYNREVFGAKDVVIFWIRRWVRTVPLYILVITGLVILRYTFTRVGFVFPWREFVFFQCFYYPEADPYYFYPEGWSLAVEEWFYFLVPAIIFVCHILFSKIISKKQLLINVILSIIIGSTALRVHRALTTPDMDIYTWNIWFYKIVLFRLDTIMFGFFAAFVRYYYRSFWDRSKNICFYLFLLGMVITIVFHEYWRDHSLWLKTFFLTQTGIIMMLWLPKLDSMKTGKGFWLKLITYLSKLTFALFLLNRTPILKSMMQLFPAKNLPMALGEYLLYFILIFGSATLFHKYLEMPIMTFRERIKQYPDHQISK
jgi:peptidoglycan/LPS O-acetylase OafA/YrhL